MMRMTDNEGEYPMGPDKINELVDRLLEALPPGFAKLPQEVKKNFRLVLESTFEKMDLVTRAEFDVQQKVLEKTREKLEELEAQLAAFEHAQGGQSTSSPDATKPSDETQ